MQQNYKAILFSAVLILGMVWIGLSTEKGNSIQNGRLPVPQKGFSAPDFTLQTLDGEEVTLSEFNGQIVLINLWASWCGPCRAEMPALQNIHQKYKDQGVVILAVNVTYQDDIASAETFVNELGITFPILMDSNAEVAHLYQLRSLPTSFFVDKDGRITEVVIGGPMAEALLQSRIESLLKE